LRSKLREQDLRILDPHPPSILLSEPIEGFFPSWSSFLIELKYFLSAGNSRSLAEFGCLLQERVISMPSGALEIACSCGMPWGDRPLAFAKRPRGFLDGQRDVPQRKPLSLGDGPPSSPTKVRVCCMKITWSLPLVRGGIPFVRGGIILNGQFSPLLSRRPLTPGS